jgi:hypothetical protein
MVEAGERLPMLQWAVTMLRIGRWVGGERLWAFVERQRRASPELPERLLPLVLAAAVLTEGLPAGAGEAARQWLRTVPEDRGELAWDPPIDLHGLALGRTEAMTEFAARVRTEACLFALDERTTRPFLAGLVWLAQFFAPVRSDDPPCRGPWRPRGVVGGSCRTPPSSSRCAGWQQLLRHDLIF